MLVTQRRFDDAILQYRKALELEPDDSLARESLDSLVQQQGTKKTVPHETKKVSDQPASTPATAAAAATKTPIASVVAKVADSSAAEKKATESKDANENGKGVTETTRPAWVDAGPQLVDDVYQMVVSVGPYTTLLECDAKLPEAIRRAVDEYAEIALGSDVVGTAWLPDAAFCRQLIKDRWQEVKPYSVGPMTQLYVLLQFDRKAKEGIADACRQGVIERRVGMPLWEWPSSWVCWPQHTALSKSRPLAPRSRDGRPDAAHTRFPSRSDVMMVAVGFNPRFRFHPPSPSRSDGRDNRRTAHRLQRIAFSAILDF